MTLVNPETGEIVEPLNADDAKRLTERIRLTAGTVADSIDKLVRLVNEARAGQAHAALGYPSWTTYVSAEFTDVLPRLSREPRRELVATLAESGMSTRAIAPVVGVHHDTVADDIRATSGVGNPTPVTGRDGKTYQRPDRATQVADAVEEFPDLEHYARSGRDSDVLRLAGALREYDEEEKARRLQTLAKYIEVEKNPDYHDRVRRGLTLVSELNSYKNELAEFITEHVLALHGRLEDVAELVGDIDHDDLPAIEEVADYLADLAAAVKES